MRTATTRRWRFCSVADLRARIIGRTADFTTPPAKLALRLERYPNLVGELSYRYDVTENGVRARLARALPRVPDRSSSVRTPGSRPLGPIRRDHRELPGWLGQLPPERRGKRSLRAMGSGVAGVRNR
jgi:hypothetical protein